MFTTLLLVLAFVLFVLGAIPAMPQRFPFMSAGLAAWVLALIVGPYIR